MEQVVAVKVAFKLKRLHEASSVANDWEYRMDVCQMNSID